MDRRGFLGSMLALGAAPAIVRAESLMRIVVPRQELVLPSGMAFLASNTIGSSLVGWRGQPVINVTDFGARPNDPLFDNSVAFRDAMMAAHQTGLPVYVSPGTFYNA